MTLISVNIVPYRLAASDREQMSRAVTVVAMMVLLRCCFGGVALALVCWQAHPARLACYVNRAKLAVAREGKRRRLGS